MHGACTAIVRGLGARAETGRAGESISHGRAEADADDGAWDAGGGDGGTGPALPHSETPMARASEFQKVKVRRAKAKVQVRKSSS